MLGHAPAALDFLGMDLSRALGRRIVSHPIQRPRKVDGRRPRRPQHVVCIVEVVAKPGREGEPVGGRDADGGGAADGKRPDRLGHLHGVPALELDLLARKPPLVEQDHRICFQTNDAVGEQ